MIAVLEHTVVTGRRLSVNILSLLVVTSCIVNCSYGQEIPLENLFPDETTENATTDTPIDSTTTTMDLTAEPGMEQTEQTEQISIVDFWNETMQMVEDENWTEAIQRLTFLASNSQAIGLRPFAHFERGKSYVALEEYDLAIRDFSQAAELVYSEIRDPQLGLRLTPAMVFLELGKARLERGDGQRDAIDDFNSGLGYNPLDPDLLYYRGVAQSKSAINEFYRQDQLRRMAAAEESLDKAIRQYERSQPDSENLADAYFERGSARSALGDLDEALEDLKKARELNTEELKYLAQIGFIYQRRAQSEERNDVGLEKTEEILQDYRDAIASFTQSIEEHPEYGKDPSLDIPTDVATEEEEAADDYTLDSLYGVRAEAHVAIAKHLPEEQAHVEYQSAISDCNMALEIEPLSYLALFQRGLAHRLMNDLKSARADFSRVLEIQPGYSPAHLHRGILWFYVGDYDLALADFTKAEQGLLDGRPKFWSGVAQAKQGKYAAAVESYSEALRATPPYRLAYNNRGLAYLRLGRYQRALDDFNEVLQHNYDSAKAHFQRALALEGLNQSDAAAQSFQRAADRDPAFAR